MKIIHRGKLKHLELTFAVGDLFDADVDAIVSSEQTDFILSSNLESVSGQIRRRYGNSIQQEFEEGYGRASASRWNRHSHLWWRRLDANIPRWISRT